MRLITVLVGLGILAQAQAPRDWSLAIGQLTRGPLHHFFGYIGQSRTIPWSGDGRYVVALRTPFQDRMPNPGEAAESCSSTPADGNRVVPVERSRGWNPQQGTMFYWNPAAPATQFFFNDRDPGTHRMFHGAL